MIKHQHQEFPSDIFLIFETSCAKLVIANVDGQRVKLSVQDFLKFQMKGKVIEKIILPAFSEYSKYESYKVMPRAQNAHALINAGFLLEITSKYIVKSSNIVYGCINSSFVHATNTEKFLIGKHIFSNETLQSCFKILNDELTPDHVLPDPSPKFRQQLAMSLFYKFVLSIAPSNLISPRNRSGCTILERSVSSGIHDYATNESLYPVTKAITKIEAIAQTSGQAEYIVDMPDLPNQLYAVFVLAKVKPLSIIKNIDAAPALNVSGVVAFLDHKDIPGENNFTPKSANLQVTEEIFCSRLVRYFNQPVGLIVATTQEIAEKSANLVVITYHSGKREPMLTVRDIVKSGDKSRISLDEDRGSSLKKHDFQNLVKGSLELSWQYHFHMETQCCNVVPTEDGLDVYPGSQWIGLSQTAAAAALNIPANKINIFIRRLGGAFGAKISRNSLISCAASIAAYKLRKPVKIWMSFETNMNVIGKRYPILCDYEVDLNSDGQIQYLESVFYSDYGCGGNEANMPFVLDTLLSTYKTENWRIKGFSTKSDNHASCYIRAPGSCEGLIMTESIMEHAAMSINMDPLEFRLRNIDAERNPKLTEFVKDFKNWANIESRKEEISSFNTENRWKKKGLSVVLMTYPFHLFANYGVIVSIYQSDGSVSIAHGGVEMGQGLNTKVAQVCAYKLGLPLEKISVKPSNNLIAPNAHMTGGSLTSEAVCNGVLRACNKLLKRIEPVRANMPTTATWEDLIKKCYAEFINLSASTMASPKDPGLDNYTVYGVCAAEIELDILTGQHILKRVDLLEDTGDSLNPSIDIGQVEGAFVMGLGYFTSEEIVFNNRGELLTNRTWNYKPPGAKDIPVDFRVKFPKNTANEVGVLGSKAMAEPPLCLACSVPLAIRQAVASFRQENGHHKWYPIYGPSTVENIFLNCCHEDKLYHM